MSRVLRLAVLSLLVAGHAWGFDEAAIADRNLAAVIVQLETGDWNDRIHAVHELDYMQSEGIPGLALATDDGDWQVRMTAVHALSSRGIESAAILNKLLRNEPCPVVRLMTLHSLGSLGPEGEEAKAMVQIFNASSSEVNACKDHPNPGRAPWARGKQEARKPVAPRPAQAPPSSAPKEEMTTSAPLPPAAARKPPHPQVELSQPTKFQRHSELDAMLDMSTAPSPRRGVVLAMGGRRTGAQEALPWPVAPIPREHEVSAPGVIMKDAGGKALHDALPGLLQALKRGDASTRARAADDLGHLGAKASSAVPALMSALSDRSARVRSSAGLALGNIGSLHKSVVPLLTKALKDRSEDVRYAAALALSRIDSPEARDAFNRHVGKEARRAIDRPKMRDKTAPR